MASVNPRPKQHEHSAGAAPEGSKLVIPPLTPAALCSSHHSIILS